jgi:hypothetical protein
MAAPDLGGTSGALDSVTVGDGTVWAVGKTQDPVSGAQPLVVHLDHGTWVVDRLPSAGSAFTDLWSVTATKGTVWAVGTFVDPTSGANKTLILRRSGDAWRVVNGPNPGPGDNILGGITSAGGRVWAVGTDSDGSREPLIEWTAAGP